jgi:cytochrome c biogenesis protein CcdA/glutaredoxin
MFGATSATVAEYGLVEILGPRENMAKLLLALALLLGAPAQAQVTPGSTGDTVAEPGTTLWYFWRAGCPFCEQADGWLEEVEEAYPGLEIQRVEVVQSTEGRERFQRMMQERGQVASGVPTFILGEQVWVGFSPLIAESLDAALRALVAGELLAVERTRRLQFGPLGAVDLDGESLLVATTLIAFVDGFNPCSLWVLTVLLAMVLGTRSRARIAAIGLTFLTVTAAIYGVFITGLFTALVVAAHLGSIQLAVAVLALGFGAVNVKDYFAYKQGLSFTIPDKLKPRIYRGGRALREDRPLPVILGLTVAFAGGVALVELPCTAGFPVIWTTLVSEAGVGTGGFGGLLAVYLLVYLLDEIVVLTVAVATLKATRMQDRHGRQLKLVSGMVMIALALVLLVDPTIMESLLGSFLVIGVSFAASGLILVLDRLYRNRTRPA